MGTLRRKSLINGHIIAITFIVIIAYHDVLNLLFRKNLLATILKMNRNIPILVYRGQLHFAETRSRRKVISDVKFTELTLKVLSKISISFYFFSVL